MLEPLDRCRRNSTLFQFTTKQLRDFIDSNHLLIQPEARGSGHPPPEHPALGHPGIRATSSGAIPQARQCIAP